MSKPSRKNERRTHAIVASGQFFQAFSRPFPKKIEGEHRIIVTVMHRSSLDAMKRAQAGGRVDMDAESILNYNAGCLDCEQHILEILANEHIPCPGDPSGVNVE